MSNNNQADSQENLHQHQQTSGDEQTNEVASSPAGSQVSQSSSSRRENRIVELLQGVENSNYDNRDDNWIIRAEFYDEDVAQNSDQMSDDALSFDLEYHRGPEDDDDDSEVMDDDGGGSDIEDVDLDPDEMVDMGFVLAPEDDDPSTSSESNENEEEAANYDTTLPVGHRYLGDDLEESRGRQILVEGSIVSLPLFNLRQIVLFPGQILPITTSNLNPRIHMYLKACITSGSTTIGLMSEPRNNPIGTTAEIRNYSTQEDEVRIIMEGRQRFKLLSTPFETAIEGKIRILPEVSLGSPCPTIASLRRFQTDLGTAKKFIVSKCPYWLLRKYEARYITKRILDQVKEWGIAGNNKNPNEFSYLVATSLPISNHERMKVLGFNCTEARLIWLLDLLEKSEYFGCSACKNVICHKSDVFLMSCSGPQCSFVNSSGYNHDTLTVRKARGLIQERGRWSSEFTWFPGYAWRIALCDNCSRHIGWSYKSIESDTKPKRFFGLSRANVRLQSTNPLDNMPIDDFI